MDTTVMLTMYIDGQNRDGSNADATPIELRQDEAGKYRWYHQAYNEQGNPDGPCTEDSGIAGETVDEALSLAKMAWAGPEWNLREAAAGATSAEEVGRRVGEAMAKDAIREGVADRRRWSDDDMSGEDGDQFTAAGIEPGTDGWDEAVKAAKAAYLAYIRQHG